MGLVSPFISNQQSLGWKGDSFTTCTISIMSRMKRPAAECRYAAWQSEFIDSLSPPKNIKEKNRIEIDENSAFFGGSWLRRRRRYTLCISTPASCSYLKLSSHPCRNRWHVVRTGIFCLLAPYKLKLCHNLQSKSWIVTRSQGSPG